MQHYPRVDSQFRPRLGVSFCCGKAAAIEPKIEKKRKKKGKGTRERKVAEGEDWLELKGREEGEKKEEKRKKMLGCTMKNKSGCEST